MFTLRIVPAASALVVLTAGLNTPATVNGQGTNPFVVVGRTVTQERGDWRVDYQIRNGGEVALVLSGDEVRARVEGWVSNSRAPGHAVPRWSSLTVSGQSGPAGREAVADVIASADDDQRCRERCVVRVGAEADSPAAGGDTRPPLAVPPGGVVRVQLRLEHKHVVYGNYDPLLGVRTVDLWLGAALVRDVLPLDREQAVSRPERVALEPPDDRRDTRFFTSAPDSLHLEAHVPGNQSYRFPEVPVRYATRMRLRFSYLLAEGGGGTFRAGVRQFKDTPNAWKSLCQGQQEMEMTEVGRWTRVERVITTEPDATTLALDFRIAGSEVGEVWVDDVSLEPVGDGRPAGP